MKKAKPIDDPLVRCTISLPATILLRLEARNENRSGQIVEELEALYLLYGLVDLGSLFTEQEMGATVQQLLAVNFDRFTTRMPVQTIRRLFTLPPPDQMLPPDVAQRIGALSTLEFLVLVDELKARYHAAKRAARQKMVLAVGGSVVSPKPSHQL